jgi:hypothetical protein
MALVATAAAADLSDTVLNLALVPRGVTMPLKLNIAISRKVGAPNFGSRGATVGLETEVDSSLIDQPAELHERIAALFRLAAESVHQELDVQVTEESRATTTNGADREQEAPVRPATANQIRALHAIANRQNLDLTAEIHDRYGVFRAADLSLDQASRLIDAIKSSANGPP